ncbi:acyltransferase family protein [Rubritalea tangerina]|uniref:Acyltransferase family protein n=1 Tax=Rubritalea tangerina TaxID=430798 RepID=A0ABW4ZE39_9BACT
MSKESESNAPAPQRLMSLDALRGFDMFLIIGGGSLIQDFTRKTQWEWDNVIGQHMQHVAWEGIQALDIVFPLFMFLAGVAIPYAIVSKLEKGEARRSLLWKVLKRVVILILLGLVYNGALSFNFESLRAASVLGQIGVAYGIAALICLYSRRWTTPVYWAAGIMLGYAALQLWLPVPGAGAGVLTQAGSVNSYIDQHFLPGRLLGGNYDPEGLLCMLSASAIVLLGYMAGVILRSRDYSEVRKCSVLAGVGIGLIVLGMLIGPHYPPIKKIWTTSFNLYAGGISMLLLAGFYLIIDVLKYQKWAFFFVVIGMNSITIYLAHRFVNFQYFSGLVFGGNASLATIILLEWLFLWFLYKKRFFLRV